MINEVGDHGNMFWIGDLADDYSFTTAPFHALCSFLAAPAITMSLLSRRSVLRLELLLVQILWMEMYTSTSISNIMLLIYGGLSIMKILSDIVHPRLIQL